jgi:uncharacterized protein (TIGR03032 family)
MTGEPGVWERHSREWRDPAEVVARTQNIGAPAPEQLRTRVRGPWWETLAASGVTLLVSREYEHLLLALSSDGNRAAKSYLRLPHPSGIAYDAASERVAVASTRNPNEIFLLEPVERALARADGPAPDLAQRPLVPRRTYLVPGAFYTHDLAWIGGRLHANAVGLNAVVRFDDHVPRIVWWPHCVDRNGEPVTERNYIQLNSIAAGPTISASFFSASAERISARRPGHLDFPVDRRGVVFSGETRVPLVRGLTRPHSARLHGGRLYVLDSGYGSVGAVEGGRYVEIARLGSWTRGLALVGGIAFVGTSRVIPRFRRYAPGLDVGRSVCGVSAVDVASGHVIASITWPSGNQIFAIEAVPSHVTRGLPFAGARPRASERLFYSFDPRPAPG